MYIQTHALLLGRTRQGEGARTAGRRGFITRLLKLNLSPPGMGVLMAPQNPAPWKSISVQAGSLGLPSLLLSLPPALAWGCLTLSPRLQVQIWELSQGHLIFKVRMQPRSCGRQVGCWGAGSRMCF